MARRTRSKKRNKIQPAEMTISTIIAAPAGFTSYYCDLSQMASLVNRRFYRQGLNWAVGGVKIRLVQAGLGSVSVSKLPTSWTFSNSWTKGFRTWQEMNKKAEDGDNVAGRFLDFKIYADSNHHQKGYGANLRPVDRNGNLAIAGEWIASEMRIPNSSAPGTSTALEIIGVGGNYPGASAVTGLNAVSLVDGYSASRALPAVTDPNTPTDLIDASGANPENWMTASSNEGLNQDSGVLDDIQAYDQPPYPYENDGTHTDTMYPGGPNQLPELVLHDVTDLSATTISGSSRLKGGNFPCGLVRIDVANYNTAPPGDPIPDLDLVFMFDMVPGDHRGYLAESMLEM